MSSKGAVRQKVRRQAIPEGPCLGDELQHFRLPLTESLKKAGLRAQRDQLHLFQTPKSILKQLTVTTIVPREELTGHEKGSTVSRLGTARTMTQGDPHSVPY